MIDYVLKWEESMMMKTGNRQVKLALMFDT